MKKALSGPPPEQGAIFYDRQGAVGCVYEAFPDRELIRPLAAPYDSFEMVPSDAAIRLAEFMTGKKFRPWDRKFVPVVVRQQGKRDASASGSVRPTGVDPDTDPIRPEGGSGTRVG